jgi:prevent-host-death family protein
LHVPIVNMLEAKSSLSRLVEAVETGAEQEIVIARNGKPAAKLVPVSAPTSRGPRVGVAKGHIEVPDSIDLDNDAVARLLAGGSA